MEKEEDEEDEEESKRSFADRVSSLRKRRITVDTVERRS
jgi:hypothetical protein